jgi:hypothetical protein
MAPRLEARGTDAPEPFRFDTPSPDDAVLLARSGKQHAQRPALQQQPTIPQPARLVAPSPADQLSGGVQALRLQEHEGEAAMERQGRAGIRPAAGDPPSTSGRAEQQTPQVCSVALLSNLTRLCPPPRPDRWVRLRQREL